MIKIADQNLDQNSSSEKGLCSSVSVQIRMVSPEQCLGQRSVSARQIQAVIEHTTTSILSGQQLLNEPGQVPANAGSQVQEEHSQARVGHSGHAPFVMQLLHAYTLCNACSPIPRRAGPTSGLWKSFWGYSTAVLEIKAQSVRHYVRNFLPQ